MTKYQFVKNQKNMRIRVCCASCEWARYNEKLKRYCLKEFECESDCSEWQINTKLYNLPKANPDASQRVKRKEYLLWLADKAEAAYKEWKVKHPEKGKPFPGVNIMKHRQEWEKITGQSIWL